MATRQNSPEHHSKTSVQVGLDAVLITAFVVLIVALFVPQARQEWLTVAPLIGGAAFALITGMGRTFL